MHQLYCIWPLEKMLLSTESRCLGQANHLLQASNRHKCMVLYILHESAEGTMSPELLGWHEQHGIDYEHGLVGAAGPRSPESESEEQPPSFHFTRLPASAIKSKPMADGSALGKAVRVKTPAK